MASKTSVLVAKSIILEVLATTKVKVLLSVPFVPTSTANDEIPGPLHPIRQYTC